ncbi:hypothetical protein [Flagellimonas sp.]|uniref:hypothetical protein n=1 Tax=Flagellimonas sp. TaxID=2058762 RepID=UPI003BA9C796
MERFYSWTIIDRFPDNDLIDINPISLRAYSLVSRNKFQIERLPISIEILGVLESMEALDYHYDNFIGFKKIENKSKRVHEIVAYLNRIGQIYYFINSDFLKKILFNPLDQTPTLNSLKVFRMKNTAHRSIDYPKNESLEYRRRQAISFFGFQLNYDENGHERFILPTEDIGLTEWHYFTPEIDHQKIMIELYNLITELINKVIPKKE